MLAQGAVPDQFTQAAQYYQHQCKPQAHHEAVYQRGQNRIFRGERRRAKNHAIGHDQRDEDTENLVQLIGKSLHQQLDTGGQRGNDHHKRRQANGVGYRAADQGHGEVGAGQHQHGCQPEAQGVDYRAADAQQWTEAKQLHQTWVVVPEAISGDFGQRLSCHWWAPRRTATGCRDALQSIPGSGTPLEPRRAG